MANKLRPEFSKAVVSVKEFAELTRIPVMAGRWNQRKGFLYQGDPLTSACCMGSKIAMALNNAPATSAEIIYAFEEGIDSAARMLGITYRQVVQLFQFVTHMHDDPFGTTEWPVTRATVWKKLPLIEHIPTSAELPRQERRLRKVRRAYFEANRHVWPLHAEHPAYRAFHLREFEEVEETT